MAASLQPSRTPQCLRLRFLRQRPVGLSDVKHGARQSAKATPFAGGQRSDGLKKAPRRLFSNVPDRQSHAFAGGNEAEGSKKAPSATFFQ
jgi:hypothetical protein